MDHRIQQVGGLVLCGGRSRRMGDDKASLPVGEETMLSRTLRILSQVVSPVVVVAAPNQELPALDACFPIVRDRREGEGPLEAIAVGLAALQGKVEAVYVTGVDVPLLQVDFVERVIALLDGEHEIALPVSAAHHHPLAAVYRPTILPTLEAMLASGERRPRVLFETVATRRIDVEELRSTDPELLSLWNCNQPDDYRAALARLGLA